MDSVQAVVKLTLTASRNSLAAPLFYDSFLPRSRSSRVCAASLAAYTDNFILYTITYPCSINVCSLHYPKLQEVRIGFTPWGGGASVPATASPLPWPPRPGPSAVPPTRYRLLARKPSRCRRHPLVPRGPRHGN